jgi:3-oxo-5-alpha-steroid 4-dehydrogenase 1
MSDSVVFNGFLLAVFLSAAVTAVILLLVDAPYGRHQKSGWGPTINTRLGWILMESPASVMFFYFYFTGANAANITCLVLLCLWQLHYLHRAFVYPFQIKIKPGDRSPLMVIVLGGVYCAINGYLNGHYIGNYGQHLTPEWLQDPRFVIGVALFAFGYYLNKRSDKMLRDLRAAHPGEYRVPQGFGFRWVSMPNYLGEIITWTGFAMASWSLAGLSFVLFTMANLVPRALANHRWYLEKFPDYPKHRKAVLPYIL